MDSQKRTAREGEAHGTLRQAVRGDIPAMHRVRLSVRENRLASAIAEADYVPAIEETGRGWVIHIDGKIVAFAVGNATTGNVWALFVDPAHEGRGHGRRLHGAMVAWLFAHGARRLWLTTQPGTRAQRFYEAAGWWSRGAVENDEIRFELNASAPDLARAGGSVVNGAQPPPGPDMDDDLDRLTRDELAEEVRKLRAGIRMHRDSSLQELCWHHPALWGLLPERTDPLPVVPEWPVFMQGCVRYRQSLDAQAPDAPRSNTPYEE